MKQERIAFRVEADVTAWLRKAAAKKRTTVSELARQLMYAAFEKRHAK